jgi:signal peptidase I
LLKGAADVEDWKTGPKDADEHEAAQGPYVYRPDDGGWPAAEPWPAPPPHVTDTSSPWSTPHTSQTSPGVPPTPGAPPPALQPAGPTTMTRIGEELVAWFKTLVSAAVYATLIVTFGFQVARVEGLSMAPTLEDQDRLIVNKLAYRMHAPQVGDIVMLFYPLDPDKSFVKRVVAEPGDTIKSVRGRVYRNDVPLPDDFIPEEYRSEDSWGPEVIPEGYYFVMGDHRNNSSDSRTWKYVPKKYIIGKVQLRWWPIDTARIF